MSRISVTLRDTSCDFLLCLLFFKSFSTAFRLSAPYPLCLCLSSLPSHPFICLPVDRLVQPLHTETLIFSHFTHFTLRPNSDLTPIRLRVHHSNSDITPTVPRHSPSHAAFHRRSPSFTVYYTVITEITETLFVINRYILTTDQQPS